MIRVKLFVLLLVILSTMVVVTLVLAGGASNDLTIQAEENLKSAKDVIRIENRIDDYSLIVSAGEVAEMPSVVRAIQCPATDEELRDANREQTPQIDPETNEPVLDAAGRPVDTEGRPIVERSGPRCNHIQHIEMLNALEAWVDAREDQRLDNDARVLSDREIGFATARRPELLIVSDADGVVVARSSTDEYFRNEWFGPQRTNMSQFPVVGRTESFGPQHDVLAWRDHDEEDPRMIRVATSPIFAPGEGGQPEYAGAVLIGHAMDLVDAEDDLWPLYDIDVAYYTGTAGNLRVEGATPSPEFLTALRSLEFFERPPDGGLSDSAVGFDAVTAEGNDKIFQFEHDGNTYLLMSSGFSGSRADQTQFAGFFVITNVTLQTAPLNRFSTVIFLAALLFLLGAGGILIAVKQFLAPVEDISKGIQEVIAGNKDYMWPVDEKSHLSDMAHSLNIMSARLQGKRDPDADDVEGSAEWAGMVGGGGGGGGEAKKPTGIAGLGNLKGRRAKKTDDGGES